MQTTFYISIFYLQKMRKIGHIQVSMFIRLVHFRSLPRDFLRKFYTQPNIFLCRQRLRSISCLFFCSLQVSRIYLNKVSITHILGRQWQAKEINISRCVHYPNILTQMKTRFAFMQKQQFTQAFSALCDRQTSIRMKTIELGRAGQIFKIMRR